MKLNVNGLSIKDIINMDYLDVLKLDRSNLAKITSRLVSASNKRIKRLSSDELGSLSPSLRNVVKSGKKFSVKNKTRSKLLEEFKRNKIFLTNKTSSLRGFKQVSTKYKQRLEKENPKFEWNKEREKKLWELVDKIRANHPEMANSKETSDQYVQLIISKYTNIKPDYHSDDYYIKRFEKLLEEEYGISNEQESKKIKQETESVFIDTR